VRRTYWNAHGDGEDDASCHSLDDCGYVDRNQGDTNVDVDGNGGSIGGSERSLVCSLK